MDRITKKVEASSGMNTEDERSGLERRKLPRVKENTFMLWYLDAEPYTEFKTTVCNISVGGLGFATEINIVPQAKLTLELFQPFDRDKTTIFSISIKAETVWIREIIRKKTCCEGENIYEAGIRFTEIKEEDRRGIEQYVEEFKG